MADGSTTTDETHSDDPRAGMAAAPGGLAGADTGDDNAEDAAETPRRFAVSGRLSRLGSSPTTPANRSGSPSGTSTRRSSPTSRTRT